MQNMMGPRLVSFDGRQVACTNRFHLVGADT